MSNPGFFPIGWDTLGWGNFPWGGGLYTDVDLSGGSTAYTDVDPASQTVWVDIDVTTQTPWS